MFNSLRRSLCSSGHIIWALIGIGLLVHMIVFLYFSQHNNRLELKVNHEIITQQVMHVLETVIQAQPENRDTIVSAINIPNITISIDPKPKWQPQLKSDMLWPILVSLRKQKQHLQMSLLLSSHQWLNVYATVISTSWTLQIILLALEVLIAVVAVFVIWSINRFSQPLQEFMQAAERMGVDLHTTPLEIHGPSVVRDTAHAMNQMQIRIQDLIRDRTQMLAAMSHDLRTPITRLKLRTQFLQDSKQAHKMVADLNEMEAMINEVLAFAREDNRHERKVKLDLCSLVTALCDDYADLGHEVKFETDEQRVQIFGRSLALKRAFSNIIDNAIKYAGRAWVHLSLQKDKIIITVEDDGPGIPEAELDRVLAPFYRGEKSRSRDTGGTGLGLAVARDIVMAHQGSIKLLLRDAGGLCVRISFFR